MKVIDRLFLYLKKAFGRIKKIQNTNNEDPELVYKEFYKNMNARKSDKLRIAFLFQIASFWPNWESFYNACLNDKNIEVKMYLLKDEVNEHSQIISAEQFLIKNEILYEEYEDQGLYEFSPHVIVLQTPYDNDHRLQKHQTAYYMKKGYRIIYIPYGIEIADTEKSRKDHFFNPVVKNCWRVFVFSELIKKDYINIGRLEEKRIVAFGHPKFDGFIHKDSYLLSDSIMERIGKRKVVVWHVHFPKRIVVDGKNVMCTPELSEYFKFANKIRLYKDLFFIVLPHPKFAETIQGERLINSLYEIENCFVDWDDDYRPAMYSADYMITDRSSLMVEVAPQGIPILYLDNDSWHEPMTDAIKPLMDSYYHGAKCYDMIKFVDMCLKGKDPKKMEREKAVSICLNLCDGNSGYRIKQYLLEEVR